MVDEATGVRRRRPIQVVATRPKQQQQQQQQLDPDPASGSSGPASSSGSHGHEYQLRCAAGGPLPAGLADGDWVGVGGAHHELVPPTAQTAATAAAAVRLVEKIGDPSLLDRL
eukprot:SAG22_NODE_1852_length_3441_cov_3.839019_4_plen_113_part_00